jgi:hypothetical protein
MPDGWHDLARGTHAQLNQVLTLARPASVAWAENFDADN